MKVVFFPVRADADAFNARCLADALASGQACEQWAEIIEAAEGFGVPVADRLTVPEKALAVDWEPTATEIEDGLPAL